MRVLLIDNYDSYTFNLFQILGEHQPVVIRNDQFEWSVVQRDILPFFDCVIISPGPGRPDKKEDFGICLNLLENAHSFTVPVFGVCLGHQGIGSVFGAQVVLAEEPMHGRLSQVRHNGSGLFEGIDDMFSVVRYHSLVVDPSSLPEELEATAWTSSNSPDRSDIIMALQHKSLPLWGVQFHPESICTEYGTKIVDNFLKMTKAFWLSVGQNRDFQSPLPSHIQLLSVVPTPLLSTPPAETSQCDFPFRKIKTAHLLQLEASFDLKSNFAERVFEECFGNQNSPRFWLDSAKVEKNLSRFSYMGTCDSSSSYTLTYSTLTRTITTTRMKPIDGVNSKLSHSNVILSDPKETFFHFISRASNSHGFWSPTRPISQNIQYCHEREGNTERDEIPEFVGGYVGYFGYEMKCESMPLPPDSPGFKTVSAVDTPDSAFLFADRLLALDHATGNVWIITLEFEEESVPAQQDRVEWIHRIQNHIHGIQESVGVVPECQPVKPPYQARSTSFTMRHGKEEYISNVESSLASIKQGETYEVCLTTKLAITAELGSSDSKAPSSLDVYKRIRARNPAPYAAFIHLPHMGISVLQSSPERFLKFDGDKIVEMKPIKGTVARPPKEGEFLDHASWTLEDNNRKLELQNNEKDRAENLMIVDLIRNDLNQISLPHTVHVPYLMHIESYATVHQLVSTIRCSLRPSLTPLDAIRATFPPGSMTGAPKLRTVEILEDLEKGPRGLYSGCLGFMSAGSGVVDMSVVIRTAVMVETKDGNNSSVRMEIGAGGAIVFLSDAVGEFEEMILKANSVLPSLKAAFGVSQP
ncbi:ADC synthase [Obelidium mucronatum]|nr:ADC synthase [Obelidium mucronatum]